VFRRTGVVLLMILILILLGGSPALAKIMSKIRSRNFSDENK
jgi:hypothetical protein